MKLSGAFATLLASVSLAIASTGAELEKRAVWNTCDTWGSYASGTYTVYQNLWGASSGTGSQCFSLDSVSGSTFAWSTTWSWSGGPYQVKSYDNISYNFASGVRVSSISSIPATWTWSQTGTSPINNVAYDLMTNASGSVSGTQEYEIMIWLGAFGGAGPISSSGSPIATPTIAGSSWRLFDGYNGSMRVFSFVATSNITNFSADLKLFLTYLATNNGFSTSQYLVVLQGGTEPFTGSNVKLTTTKFTLALNTGTTTTAISTTRTSTSSGSTPTGVVPVYGQCGGAGYTGPTACASGSTCVYSSEWYSQCVPS